MTNDFEQSDFDRACGNLASMLTAFFDGQATPAEARLARAHLRECGRCAELWLDWKRAQELLRDDITAAPPGLAQRILIACRMEGFRRAGAPRHATADARPLPPEIVAMTLGLQSFDNFRRDEAEEIAPPAYLRDAILDLTTRAAGASPVSSDAVVAPVRDDVMAGPALRTAAMQTADVAQLRETVLLQTGDSTGYKPRRVIQRAFALAVPAMLLLVMWPGRTPVSQQNAVTVTPLVSSAESALHTVVPARDVLSAGARPVSSGKPARTADSHLVSSLHTGQEIGENAVEQAPAIDSSAPTEALSTRASAMDIEQPADRAAEDRRVMRPLVEEAAYHPRPVVVEEVTPAREAPDARMPQAAQRVATPTLIATNRGNGMRVAMASLAMRSATPRLLTTVAYTPVSLRSAVVRPALLHTDGRSIAAMDTHSSTGDNDSSTDADSSSLDGRLAVAPVMESYSAALAEDVDQSQISG